MYDWDVRISICNVVKTDENLKILVKTKSDLYTYTTKKYNVKIILKKLIKKKTRKENELLRF